MRKIAIVTHGSLQDYVLDTFASHPEFEGEVVCFLAWEEVNVSFYRGVPVRLLSKLSSVSCDTVLIMVRGLYMAIDIFCRVLSNEEGSGQAREVFLAYPSCWNNHEDFISGNAFTSTCVRRLPASVGDAIEAAAEMFPGERICVPSELAAKRTYTTRDGIQAYEMENIFVKIGKVPQEVSGLLIGCTYTSEKHILDSCINKAISVPPLLFTEDFPLDTRVDIVYDDSVCILTRIWSFFYYSHFLYEVCDKILVAEELGFKGRYMLFHNPDAEKFLTWLGIPLERVIWVEKEDLGKVYWVKKAFDVEGFRMATGKGLPRLFAFADRIGSMLDGEKQRERYPRRLYVKRIGRRKLLDVEDILEKYGFFTMVPENYSIEEEIRFFRYADIILCPHGNALANILFMEEGKALVETLPCNWIYTPHLTTVIAKKLVYRQIVEPCTKNPPEETGQERDYKVDNHLLDYTLEELTKKYPIV